MTDSMSFVQDLNRSFLVFMIFMGGIILGAIAIYGLIEDVLDVRRKKGPVQKSFWRFITIKMLVNFSILYIAGHMAVNPSGVVSWVLEMRGA